MSLVCRTYLPLSLISFSESRPRIIYDSSSELWMYLGLNTDRRGKVAPLQLKAHFDSRVEIGTRGSRFSMMDL